MLTSEDLKLFSTVPCGGYHLFAQAYYDWNPMKHQYAVFYAPQPNVTFVAGIGAGKTSALGMLFLTRALTIPYYRALNTSISSFQANLMFELLRGMIESNTRIQRFIKEIRVKPYPKITTHINSYIAFMTVGFQAQGIRGSEWDEINFDEGGYERSEETIIALRGRLRGRREDGTPRIARLFVTTTPTDVPWLRKRWERGVPDSKIEDYDPKSYFSLRATLFDNVYIPDWQREEIIKDMPAEMVKQEVMAEFPDWGESEFAEEHINACENPELNALMEHYTNPIVVHEDGSETSGTPVKGALVMELPRIGIVRWEMPAEAGRIYAMAADPGTGNPPKRNAGVVMVFDVTHKPYRLVFMHWVSGNGSYTPWLATLKYALEKYNPVIRGLDSTGPQKAIDELVLEREGIHVDSVTFSTDKTAMLNSLKLMVQNHEIEWPFIKGLRTQLRAYRRDDKDLAQDLVATLMVFAYVVRFLQPKEVTTYQLPTTSSRTRTPGRRQQQVMRRAR